MEQVLPLIAYAALHLLLLLACCVSCASVVFQPSVAKAKRTVQ